MLPDRDVCFVFVLFFYSSTLKEIYGKTSRGMLLVEVWLDRWKDVEGSVCVFNRWGVGEGG